MVHKSQANVRGVGSIRECIPARWEKGGVRSTTARVGFLINRGNRGKCSSSAASGCLADYNIPAQPMRDLMLQSGMEDRAANGSQG